MTTCTKCASEVEELAVFPDGLCLACYSETPEATAPLTEAGLTALTRLWGGKR